MDRPCREITRTTACRFAGRLNAVFVAKRCPSDAPVTCSRPGRTEMSSYRKIQMNSCLLPAWLSVHSGESRGRRSREPLSRSTKGLGPEQKGCTPQAAVAECPAPGQRRSAQSTGLLHSEVRHGLVTIPADSNILIQDRPRLGATTQVVGAALDMTSMHETQPTR
jgi:hypothetical protein